MNLSRWMLIAGLGLAAVGCQSKKPMAEMKPEVDDVKFGQVRSDLLAANPNTIVGRVVNVDTKEGAAEIGELSADVLRANDTVLILKNSQDAAVASGTVFNKTTNTVMIRYQVEDGGRAPMKGDVAVHIPLNSTQNMPTPGM